MSEITKEAIDRAREAAIDARSYLNEQRRELEFQMARVKNAEALLAQRMAIWEGFRDAMINEVRAS